MRGMKGMRGTIGRWACLVFCLLSMAGCGDGAPEENLRIVMQNQTGGNMHDFKLSYGNDDISYQIFSKDYTFSANPTITQDSVLHLAYKDDDGTWHDFDLEWTVKPSHNEGRLDLTFLPEDQVEIEFQGMRDTEVPEDAGDILAQAKARYDRLDPGMSVETAGELIGFAPRPDDRKYSWGKNFGYFGRKEAVELTICVFEGEVVRLSLSYPHDSDKKGQFIKEKGISEQEWKEKPRKWD